MRLLLDENAPMRWVSLLIHQGHHAEHVIDRGWSGSSDRDVLAHSITEELTLLTLNKFKKGPDRRDALMAMRDGARIIRVTVRGLMRQEQALERRITSVESAFAKDPSLRRATIMNDFRVRYESEADIRLKIHGAPSRDAERQ